jgi:hypothetical protein
VVKVALCSMATIIVVAGSSATASRVGCPSASGASVVSRVGVPGRPGFLLLKGDDLWVAVAAPHAEDRGAVARVDAQSGRLRRVVRLPIDPYQLAYGFGSL